MEFTAFPKMARLSRECVITEKIDGTNAQIFIREFLPEELPPDPSVVIATKDSLYMFAGSRTKWVMPGKQDNYNFAAWVQTHAEELFQLGEGHHFGEWWGKGIQRGYAQVMKKFSLFNTSRWNAENPPPACCYTVPELYRGIFDTETVLHHLTRLERNGSFAAPGFMDPEGIVVYHTAAGVGFKKTVKGDEHWKGQQ